MQIQITNGTVEILDIIPYSLVKSYTREVTKIAVSLGIDGKSPDDVQAKLTEGDEVQKMKTVEFGYMLEDAKENLVKQCITSFSGNEDIEKAIENYEITPQDIENISIDIMKKIEKQNAKKNDTPNTSETSPQVTSE